MKTDLEKQSGQRKPVLLVSGVVAVCLFVLALLERRRSSATAPPPVSRRPHAFGEEPAATAPTVDASAWEEAAPALPGHRESETVTPFAEHVFSGVHHHNAEVEVEVEPIAEWYPEPQAEVETELAAPPFEPAPFEPAPFEAAPFEAAPYDVAPYAAAPSEATASPDEAVAYEPAVDAEQQDAVIGAPVAEEPVAPVDSWFGAPAPASPWQSAPQQSFAPQRDPDPVAPEQAASSPDDEPVIELPPTVASAPVETDPKRLPPPRLRRFMGTGATVLVLGLVLCTGVLASGATADSTSDPATVPDAVATTAPLPGVLPDSTVADTTTTDTTLTDTTSTDTTTTGTTTTSTTTTDTTATTTTPTDTTTTTTTPTTPTDTTVTTTTTTPTPTPTPTATTPVVPPASDPVAAPPVAPDAGTPAVAPAPPATLPPPATPVKQKVAKKVVVEAPAPPAPAKAEKVVTPDLGTPVASGDPVVTSASGSDAIGSILSAHSVIPAVDASLLPTPAQVSFYVQAAKPLAKLPPLARIDHAVAQRLVAAGRHGKVSWTVLAAIARLESNLGARPGPLAGRNLPTAPSGDGLVALAAFLQQHGATRNPLAPTTARTALTLYFHGSTRKADRAIALAALYGALGPAGMQHGVRAETARLQKRVLADRRVHLTIAGRSDIRHGRVDPRVLVTLEYLANSFRKVGISDLVSGGALFSRSGSVSAHLYGRAADVASLHGTVVRGHQGPGTVTEQAIKKLLMLPKSLRPRQVISLMDVDGPTGNHGSFALPDHYDRIQIDY